ncbi:MAG: hypothetical protein NVSMB10_09380 [Steroidobacteraceae bacterium]
MKPAIAGFTLIELLVAVVVVAILISVAVPSFQTFVLNDRDSGQINALSSSFNYARSEAVKRNTSAGVKVCPSSDALTCNTPVGGWAGGWIVLDMDPLDTAPVLQALPGLGGANTVTASGGGASAITFKSSGAVAASAKIKICDPRGSAYARDVEVSPVGTITASQTVGKDAAGNALTCP